MGNMLDLINLQNLIAVEEARQEILVCNEYSEQFGLTLTSAEAAELVENRSESLKNAGRVEFGGGILPKLIYAFCDSPYMEAETYAETLAELQETFYYYKSEAMEALSDDELIENMVAVFNGQAQGSAEYLSGTSLDALCRYARSGYASWLR